MCEEQLKSHCFVSEEGPVLKHVPVETLIPEGKVSMLTSLSVLPAVLFYNCLSLFCPQWNVTTLKRTVGTPCLPWGPGGSTSAAPSTRT